MDVEVHESATELEGAPALIGSLFDITDRKRAEAQIAERAFVDPLTRLPNRVRFLERLEIELAQSRRYDRKLAVVHLDLDGFKFVNDNWGHAAGDRLLQSLALRLTRGVREVDTIARIGGDEFLILVPDLRQSGDMSRFAQKLLGLMGRAVEIDGHTLQVTTSVGVATYPDDGQDAEALLRNADAAMYRAKDLGGNNFELCTPELTAMAVERLELQNGLRQALDRNEFLLHYQPLVSLGSGRIVGLEALVRWQHPEKGLVPPATFIPVAEETGLILPLGDWVLRAATSQLKTWLGTGLGLRISVNFSAKQFRERSLVHTVEGALSKAGLEPRHLEVEITESIAMEGAEIVVANLNLLRTMGVGIAIDDFGTGYSSMSYLKSFPITSLKIDRSFVTDLATNPADAGIVRAIVEMAHGSRLSVIAEGVETQDQFQFLQKYGCDEMQGYWVSRPLADRRHRPQARGRDRALEPARRRTVLRRPEPRLQLRGEHAVEELLAALAPHRQPPGPVGARAEAPLDRVADREVLVLDPVADVDRGLVPGDRLGRRHVGEVEVEDDLGPAGAERAHEVRVHDALVPVDHEVRPEPVVEGLLALAHGGDVALGVRVVDRAPLQAPVVPRLDRVAAVVEDGGEALVQVRHVVAAVEVVVDEDLPVALEGPAAPLDEVEPRRGRASRTARRGGRATVRATGPRARGARRRISPRSRSRRPTRPFFALSKPQTPAKSGVPFSSPASEYVQPWYGQRRIGALPSGSVMTEAAWWRQTLKKPADHAVLAAHDDDRLAREHRGEVLAGLASWSRRPTICHVREKTVRRSSSAMRWSTYQGAGIVQASSSGAFAS